MNVTEHMLHLNSWLVIVKCAFTAAHVTLYLSMAGVALIKKTFLNCCVYIVDTHTHTDILSYFLFSSLEVLREIKNQRLLLRTAAFLRLMSLGWVSKTSNMTSVYSRHE